MSACNWSKAGKFWIQKLKWKSKTKNRGLTLQPFVWRTSTIARTQHASPRNWSATGEWTVVSDGTRTTSSAMWVSTFFNLFSPTSMSVLSMIQRFMLLNSQIRPISSASTNCILLRRLFVFCLLLLASCLLTSPQAVKCKVRKIKSHEFVKRNERWI